MKAIIATTSAVLCLVSAGQAAAQSELDQQGVAVSYADLDLSRAGGRAVLEQRVGQAVKTVCPERPSPRELTKMKIYRDCQAVAWTGARQQLAAIYDGRQLAVASVQVSSGRK